MIESSMSTCPDKAMINGELMVAAILLARLFIEFPNLRLSWSTCHSDQWKDKSIDLWTDPWKDLLKTCVLSRQDQQRMEVTRPSFRWWVISTAPIHQNTTFLLEWTLIWAPQPWPDQLTQAEVWLLSRQLGAFRAVSLILIGDRLVPEPSQEVKDQANFSVRILKTLYWNIDSNTDNDSINRFLKWKIRCSPEVNNLRPITFHIREPIPSDQIILEQAGLMILRSATTQLNTTPEALVMTNRMSIRQINYPNRPH